MKTKKLLKNFLSLVLPILFLVGVIAPASYLLYSISGDLAFTNATESTNIGARISAAVLSMDFNSPSEVSNGVYQENTYVKDGSVYNNFGTLIDYNPWQYTNSNNYKINSSLIFDGSNDQIAIPFNELFNSPNITQQLTVSLWINPTGTQLGYGRLVEKDLSKSWGIDVGAGGNNIELWIANNLIVTGTNAYTPGTWSHIVITYNGTMGSIYKDGTLLKNSTTSYKIGNETSGITFGKSAGGGALVYKGFMDEVMFFNRSITASEVSVLYGNQSAGTRTSGLETDASLFAYYPLDYLSANISRAVDISNSSLNGTLTNYPTTNTNPTYNSTGGVSGTGAYQFDGSNDYIEVPISSHSGTSLTYTATFKPNENPTTTYDYVLGKTGFYIMYSHATSTYQQACVVTPDASNFYAAKLTTALTSGNWYTMTCVYNGTHINAYLNGNLEKSTALSTTLLTTGNFYIGTGPQKTQNFNGTIDNIQVFNRAFTASEVLDLYNGTLANQTIKYSTKQGDFKSGIFYNSTPTYWAINLSTADTTSRSGLVNQDNSINLSNPNLVSYWPLDGNYNDAKGLNNGTCTSSTCPNNATGLSSNAMRFDGVDDKIQVNESVIKTNNVGAISFWANRQGGVAVLGSYNVTETSSYHFEAGYGYGGAFFDTQIYGGAKAQSLSAPSGSPPSNSWNHLVFTSNGTLIQIYVNGILQTLTVQSGSNSGYWFDDFPIDKIYLGYSNMYGTLRQFNGSIDEVLIYNTSLTASQVSQLYKSGLSRIANTNITLQTRTANTYNTTDQNLVALWNFNDNSNEYSGRNNFTITAGNLTDATGFIGKGVNCTQQGNGYYNGSTTGLIPNNLRNITVSLWFNPTVAGGSFRDLITLRSTNAANYPYNIEFYQPAANQISFVIADRTATYTVPSTNRWYHAVGTWNTGENHKLYIDGNLVTTGSASDLVYFNLSNSPISICGTPWIAGRNYLGYLDEIRIYNRSLSASEVADLYNLGTTHITDWSAWSSESLVNDSVAVNTSVASKFIQFKNNFYSNTTDISPYVISYNATAYPDYYAPNVTASSPANSTLLNNGAIGGINFTANLTDQSAGIRNATLTILNASNVSQIVNQTSINVSQSANVLTATVGIVVSLVDGAYNWFWSIFDWGSNQVSTANRTITVDNTLPNATLNLPGNNFVLNSSTQDSGFGAIQIGNVTTSLLSSGNYVSSSDLAFTNATESTNLGARISAAVLSMDFNSPSETPYGTSPFYCDSNNSACVGTYVKDNSVYNNYGTVSGYFTDSNYRIIGQKLNNSLQFMGNVGTNSYVNLTTKIQLGTNQTITGWFRWTGASYSGSIAEIMVGNGGYIQYDGDTTANGCTSALFFNAGTDANMGICLNNTWKYITFVRDGNNVTSYTNGVYTTSKAPGSNSINITVIGSRTDTETYGGSMDELMFFNRSLSSTEVANLYNNQSAGQRNSGLETDANLVAYYKFDETSGTTTADAMGIYNGTLIGYTTTYLTTPTYNSTGGVSGSGAYQFDGSNDKITTSALGTPASGFSYSIWFKPMINATAKGSYNTLLATAYWGAYQHSANNRIYTTTGSSFISNNFPIIGQWNHLVCNFNSTTSADCFLNGVRATWGNSFGTCSAASALWIGSQTDGTGVFNGTIDNIQIFPRLLTYVEMIDLWNGTNYFTNSSSNKYSTKQGDFKSGVFYNSTPTYWAINLSTADTTSRSGLVNSDNSINLSNPNLVSYWALDGNYLDAKGRNNGTCSGTACPNNASGLSSNAMRFDGVDDKVQINESVIKNNNVGTISFWANRQGGVAVLGSYNITEPNSYHFEAGYGYGGAFFDTQIYGGAKAQALSTPSGSTPSNTWNHVIITSNGTLIQIYVNGALQTLTVQSGSNSGYWFDDFPIDKIYLGYSNMYGTLRQFNGSIDEVLIYNTSLTASQISQIYKSGLSQHANTNITLQTRTANTYNTSDPNLVALWNFNNDSSKGENNTYYVDEKGRFNLTCTGAACPINNVTNGIVGNGIYSNASGLSLNATDSTGSLSADNLTTISLWVYPITTPDNSYVIWKGVGATGANTSWNLYYSSSQFRFDIYVGNGTSSYTSQLFPRTLNTWQHVVITTNESNYMNFYINGQFYTSKAITSLRGIKNFGGINIGGYTAVQRIDEVRIYNRSLSAAEVLDLYNLGTTHINWSNGGNYTSEQLLADSAGMRTDNQGKFVQFKANLKSNTTDISPYVISYNVSSAATNGNIKNLTANISDNLAGVANATLIIVNVSNQSQQIGNATLTLSNPLTASIGIVVSLVDGLYSWFYRIFDSAGNLFTTSNNTLIVDNVFPGVILNSPSNAIYTSSNNVNFTANVSDNVQVSSATLYVYNSTNSLIYSSNITGINSTSALVGINTTLSDGNYNWTYSVIDVAGYSNISANRTITIDRINPALSFETGTETNGSVKSQNFVYVNVSLTDTNLANATFSLFNSTHNLVTNTTVSYANITGGTITYDGLYTIHTFTSNGTFTVPNNVNAEVLVVAGGGGGGGAAALSYGAGGGGAGGVNYTASISVASNTYSVTVGTGGSAGSIGGDGGNGSSSSLGSLVVATGGGGGARGSNSPSSNAGLNGGSGGGASNSNTYGTGITGQGYRGGTGSGAASWYAGGGGGGSSAVGGAGSGSAVGAGGAGTNYTISGGSVTYGTGGNGGGGSSGQNGVAGTNNEGDGGSGASGIASAGVGGAGGSGIVIIRYLTPVKTINWTELSNGVYYYNVSTYDLAGNYNKTETRTITLDTTNPNATLISPTNNSYSNNQTNNFTANLTDNLGIANSTLNIYNSSGLVNSTIVQYAAGVTQTVVGTVVTLIDGVYTWFYNLFDFAGNQYSTSNNTLTVDVTYPIPIFTSPTPNNDSGSNVQITIKINVTEINPANATISWNGANTSFTSGNFTQISSNLYQFNVTNRSALLAGQFYYYNITVCDLANNCNITETRLVKGNTAPTITNNSGTTESGYYNSSEIIANFSVSDNEGNMNYSAVFLYFKPNWTADLTLFNETNSTDANSANFSLNYSGLSEGIYYLNASATDLVGEYTNSSTRIIVLDRTNGSALNLIDNNSYFNYTNVNITANLSDNLGIANATLNIFNASNLSQIINQTTLNDFAEGTVQTTIGIVVNLVDGIYNWFWNVFDWAGNAFNTENQTLTTDIVAPRLTNIVYSPSDNDSIDPETLMQFNVTIVDETSGTSSAILEIFNGSAWENRSMERLTGNKYNGTWNANFTTASTEINYTFKIWTNDTSTNTNETQNYTFKSSWDCTWRAYAQGGDPSSLGETGGFNGDLPAGNLLIENTGDANYSNSCVLGFTFKYTQGNSIVYPDFSLDYLLESSDSTDSSSVQGFTLNGTSLPSYTLIVPAKTNTSLAVVAGFPQATTVLNEDPSFNVTANVTDSEDGITTEIISANIIVTPGAFLGIGIETPSATYKYSTPTTESLKAYLFKGNNITIPAYVKDVVSGQTSPNNTAYNVSFNWTLPSAISSVVSNSNLTNSYDVLNDTSKQYNNLTLLITDSNIANLAVTDYDLNVYSYGYENSSGNLTLINHTDGNVINDSINIEFKCYSSATDSYCPSGCSYSSNNSNYDPDCSAPAPVTEGGTSSSGGGGGGGGVSGNLYEKSEATYELLAGEEQQFVLPIQNKLDSPKGNISIKVSGINSQYISIVPQVIDYIAPKSSVNLTVKITAPAYFTQGKYLLKFDLTGEVRGNATSKFVENKYVTLYIVEVQRSEADKMVADSLLFFSEMNKSGFKTSQIEEYLSQMNLSYSEVDFLKVKEIFQELKAVHDSAIQSEKLIEELKTAIAEAEKRGINVDETKKLLFSAETIYERGDYVSALKKLQEVQLSYALQVKGEFNLLYEVKNNPVQSMFILIGVSLFGVGSSLVVRSQLLRAKIKLLKEEQTLLLQLMKVVQTDCFEKNKLSMEEYNESMNQYEKRLSEVIQEIIRSETQMYNLLKIKGKVNALKQEKIRIISMIKELQTDYLQKGKIETRVYENMLKSYTSRLSKVDEELVFIETKQALAGK